MAEADIWMPLYTGDYLKATMGLKAKGHGAYLLLMMYHWENNGIPDDIEELLSVSRLEEQDKPLLEKILNKYFVKEEDCYIQKRCAEEKEKAEEKSRKARESANKRWNKDPEDMRTQCERNANAERTECSSPSPSPINILSTTETATQRFEKNRKHWNDAGLPKYKYTLLNTRPEDTKELMPTLDAYTDEEIQEAIDNYRKIRDTEGYDLDPAYQSFPGFMKAGKGVDKYVSDADPFTRCRINGRSRASPQEETRTKAKAVYDIARRARNG